MPPDLHRALRATRLGRWRVQRLADRHRLPHGRPARPGEREECAAGPGDLEHREPRREGRLRATRGGRRHRRPGAVRARRDARRVDRHVRGSRRQLLPAHEPDMGPYPSPGAEGAITIPSSGGRSSGIAKSATSGSSVTSGTRGGRSAHASKSCACRPRAGRVDAVESEAAPRRGPPGPDERPVIEAPHGRCRLGP